jgi:hypothetical protein
VTIIALALTGMMTGPAVSSEALDSFHVFVIDALALSLVATAPVACASQEIQYKFNACVTTQYNPRCATRRFLMLLWPKERA